MPRMLIAWATVMSGPGYQLTVSFLGTDVALWWKGDTPSSTSTERWGEAVRQAMATSLGGLSPLQQLCGVPPRDPSALLDRCVHPHVRAVVLCRRPQDAGVFG